jgi:PKD repeat protein
MKTKLTLIIILAAVFLSVGIASAAPAGQPSCDFSTVTISGPEDLIVTFTGTAYNMSAPFSYHWDFGDSTGAEVTSVSTVSPITHTYLNPGKYTVSLAVYDVGFPITRWYESERTDYITVTHIPPVANFTYGPHHGNAPLGVNFFSTSTGVDFSLTWDFGDNTTGEGLSPTHTYPTKGNYTVILTATNDGGSTTKTAFVSVTPPPPVANFEAVSATTGAKPFAVQFNDTSVYDGNIITWSWKFGDGATSTEQNPLHVYTASGNYDVYLMVDTLSGNSEKFRFGYVTVLDSPEICPTPAPTPVPTPTPEPTVCPDQLIIIPDGLPTYNIGIFRPSTGAWYLDSNGDRLYDKSFLYGGSEDIPVPADYNGDGKTDTAIYRPSLGRWYIDMNGDRNPEKNFHYGAADDIPYAVDFNKDGRADMTIFRPSTGYWYIDTDLNGIYDISFRYGGSGDVPLFGNWT